MIRLKLLSKEWLSAHNKFYISPLVCINPKLLSFIIDNTDIDFLSPHLPTSPPSVDTKMTVAREIPLNLFAIKLIFTFINSNLTADMVEGSMQGAVNFLQHSSSVLTGTCLL